MTIDLKRYGIENVQEIYHNLSYEELYKHETAAGLQGYEVGEETTLGAINVNTGIFTGRSPKDKYIVKDEVTENTVWWAGANRKGSDNKPINQEIWQALLDNSRKQLNGKKLYVMDAFCGANENTRLKVRVICEVAWQAHFVKNMFIRPTEEELERTKSEQRSLCRIQYQRPHGCCWWNLVWW